MRESTTVARIAVLDFVVHSPVTGNGEHGEDELREMLDDAAEYIYDAVGSALADLGTACTQGVVKVMLENALGSAGE